MQKPQEAGKNLNLDAALTPINNQAIETETHIAIISKVADTGQNPTTTGAARGVKSCVLSVKSRATTWTIVLTQYLIPDLTKEDNFDLCDFD